jgi:hypothetical protein
MWASRGLAGGVGFGLGDVLVDLGVTRLQLLLGDLVGPLQHGFDLRADIGGGHDDQAGLTLVEVLT